MQFDEDRPARLQDIYLPVEVAFEQTPEERAARSKGEKHAALDLERFAIGLGEREAAIGLLEALEKSRALVVIGIPGSGKSTLLQWLGLCCAHARLGQKRLDGQKEWCYDWYDPAAYQRESPVRDPRGPETGQARALRGGAWDDSRYYARCAYRIRYVPDSFFDNIGFRLVCAPNLS